MEIKSTIDLKDYKLLDKIGHGAFGDVFKVKNKKNNTIYAAKISQKSLEDDSIQTLRDFSREVNILSKVKHPSVLDFIGFSSINFQKEKKPVIITELLPNGSLNDILEAERKGLADSDWNMTRKLINIYGIASAMFFLHSHHIIHRDLKPANILMDEYLCPKIADFGLSKILHLNKESMTIESTINIKGTPLYMSPEIWQKNEYGPACDVYAFAIIVLEVISNSEPFKNCNFYQITSKVMSGERPEIDLTVPDCYRELIERCWSQDPKDRPSFEEIVNELRSEDNNQFITELVDENDFWNYVDFIDDFQKVFDSEQKIIKIDDFIKNKSKSSSKNSLKKSIFESAHVKVKETNDSFDYKKTSEKQKSKRFSISKSKSKENLIYPTKEFNLLNQDCQDLVLEAQNDAEKQFEVGCCLFEGNQNFPLKTEIGIKYLEQSIKGGCIDSLIYYSRQLIEAKVIPQDLNKAEKLLKKNLKSDNSNVQLLLGKIRKKEKNFKKAIKYFDIASKKGNCEAMYEYGKLLFKGKGCRKDEKEATKYFEMSKKNGFDKSDDFLLKLKPKNSNSIANSKKIDSNSSKQKPEIEKKTITNANQHSDANSNSKKIDSSLSKQKPEIEKKTITNANQHSDANSKSKKIDSNSSKQKPEIEKKTITNDNQHSDANSKSKKIDSSLSKQKPEIEKKTITNANQHSDENSQSDDSDIKVIKGKEADTILSNLKEKDGIKRVIYRSHSMDKSKTFTFKNTRPANRITDESLLQTDKTSFPIARFISHASNLICLLISNASDNKIDRASNYSYPYELLSVNLLIDCSSYIPEHHKMFNVLLLTSFAYALNFLHVPYEICVVADQKFRFILKSFEEPHSIKALQRVLDCVLIKRYRTNYPDTFHHTVEYMNNPDKKRTQRAVFLFSDGLDENLVLSNAWKKQILNNSAISYGILVTIPQLLSRDDRKYMENVWKHFTDETKNAISIARIAAFESNLNNLSNTHKIVNCFKDVISRAISIQSTYKPSRDPKPRFDSNIPDLSTNSYVSFEYEMKMRSKVFVSIEKSAPLTSNKIHIDKLDTSYYSGKTSKIIKCNVDKANSDSFASFIHRLTSKQKDIFISQIDTIFKPNKASTKAHSDTGGSIRNYGVTVVIDTSISCFNFTNLIHSVQTVINVLCAISSAEIPCVDVILSTKNEPIVLCSEVTSIHALSEKSSIWPALFSYILQQDLGESNLEAGIHAAYDLHRMRSNDYSSILFVLTDGLYMAERKKRINEHVMASIQLGINVVGIGIGVYPIGITDIFPQSVFAPSPNEIIRAISCCFGDDNPDPLERITPSLPAIPPNSSFFEICNKFKEYDQNPVFRDLKEKLKKTPVALDASYEEKFSYDFDESDKSDDFDDF